jgi:hypothetical protein
MLNAVGRVIGILWRSGDATLRRGIITICIALAAMVIAALFPWNNVTVPVIELLLIAGIVAIIIRLPLVLALVASVPRGRDALLGLCSFLGLVLFAGVVLAIVPGHNDAALVLLLAVAAFALFLRSPKARGVVNPILWIVIIGSIAILIAGGRTSTSTRASRVKEAVGVEVDKTLDYLPTRATWNEEKNKKSEEKQSPPPEAAPTSALVAPRTEAQREPIAFAPTPEVPSSVCDDTRLGVSYDPTESKPAEAVLHRSCWSGWINSTGARHGATWSAPLHRGVWYQCLGERPVWVAPGDTLDTRGRCNIFRVAGEGPLFVEFIP